MSAIGAVIQPLHGREADQAEVSRSPEHERTSLEPRGAAQCPWFVDYSDPMATDRLALESRSRAGPALVTSRRAARPMLEGTSIRAS
jgi:hypothetical protein